MANPQLEDGFMRVANGIVDNICKLSLNGTEQKVIWCVIRYTYGFNRKSHRLRGKQLMKIMDFQRKKIRNLMSFVESLK